MRKRWVFGVLILLLLVVAGCAAGAYAFDSSRNDMLAKGVVVAGIDVGGMRASEALEELNRRLLPRLRRPVVVHRGSQRFVLTASAARVRLDVIGMVQAALATSREGSFVSRVWREATGGTIPARVRLHITYSSSVVERFARSIKRQIDRKPRDAEIVPSPTALRKVRSQNGIAVRPRVLARSLGRQLTSPSASHAVRVPTLVVQPRTSTRGLAARYPFYITISRSRKELRLFARLKLVRVYRIAVGQIGLETPAGKYRIESKVINPSWQVPNSLWAGSLAGHLIPPGPEDPLKARWMGFYDGAGIHGTDATYSLGTAASHGCIRMSVPDVIDLFDRVPLHTPLYIA